jgi:hypothetical protein
MKEAAFVAAKPHHHTVVVVAVVAREARKGFAPHSVIGGSGVHSTVRTRVLVMACVVRGAIHAGVGLACGPALRVAIHVGVGVACGSVFRVARRVGVSRIASAVVAHDLAARAAAVAAAVMASERRAHALERLGAAVRTGVDSAVRRRLQRLARKKRKRKRCYS